MTNVRMRDLPNVAPSSSLRVLVDDPYTHTGTITIAQLLGLQQEQLNKPCPYCGSRGKYDVRGNCGACGAPQ